VKKDIKKALESYQMAVDMGYGPAAEKVKELEGAYSGGGFFSKIKRLFSK
jgi:TPR repeat protein